MSESRTGLQAWLSTAPASISASSPAGPAPQAELQFHVVKLELHEKSTKKEIIVDLSQTSLERLTDGILVQSTRSALACS